MFIRKNNSSLIYKHVHTGGSDTNYNAYEIKVDKLAARVNELETNFKLFISTTIDMHNLKQSIVDSEQNLKNTLRIMYTKV